MAQQSQSHDAAKRGDELDVLWYVCVTIVESLSGCIEGLLRYDARQAEDIVECEKGNSKHGIVRR